MTAKIGQKSTSKVVIFYKNGDEHFPGFPMAITPRRYRNMDTLFNDLNRRVILPLGVRYVLTKSGESVKDVDDFQNGQVYICSSYPKLQKIKYGVSDRLPHWNSSKQAGKTRTTQHLTKIDKSVDERHTRRISDTIKPRIIHVVRYGHKPRRVVKVLLNKRTAQTFDQVLDEVTTAIGVWGSNGVRRLYNMEGKRMSDVLDLFKEDYHFIAVGNEKFHLSDLDDILEPTTKPGLVKKIKLPFINHNGPTQENDISQIADSDKDKPTHEIKSRNSIKLPAIGRKSIDDHETNNLKSGLKQNVHKQKSTKSHNSGSKSNEIEKVANQDNMIDPQLKVNHLNSSKTEHIETTPKSQNVEDVYILGEKIGDGNFAVVRIGTERQTKTKYALKIIDRKKINGKEDMLKDEIQIMKSCDHVNIAQLHETYQTPFDIYLVMEFVSGGDLFDEISNFVKFEEPIASSFARDIVRALDYLHQRHIVHRDLKPENLLVHINGSGKKQLKLADFGLAVQVKAPLFTVCGTPTYVAPEILEETGYGLEVDIWAAGVIVYIMLCGFPPFRSPNKDQDELFDLIVAGDYEFLAPYWDNVSTEAKDLVKNLLLVDTKQRYRAQRILLHPWLQQENGRSTLDTSATAQARRQGFDARRKFKGAAIAVKGSRKLYNIAKEFQLKRDEKLIA